MYPTIIFILIVLGSCTGSTTGNEHELNSHQVRSSKDVFITAPSLKVIFCDAGDVKVVAPAEEQEEEERTN